MNAIVSSVASPCTGVCRIDSAGFCEGCRRSMDEIIRWPEAGAPEKRAILERIRERAVPADTTN